MRDHKSLDAWKVARSISLRSLEIYRRYWTPPAAEVFRQLQRATLSIQLNIAEGHALGDRGRFGNHLAVAYGSATESAELVELMLEEGIVPRATAEEWLSEIQRCRWLLLGLLKRYRPIPPK